MEALRSKIVCFLVMMFVSCSSESDLEDIIIDNKKWTQVDGSSNKNTTEWIWEFETNDSLTITINDKFNPSTHKYKVYYDRDLMSLSDINNKIDTIDYFKFILVSDTLLVSYSLKYDKYVLLEKRFD